MCSLSPEYGHTLCAVILLTSLGLTGCEREARLFTPLYLHSTHAGTQEYSSGALAVGTRYERNAYAVAEGKRLFRWYNCNGCHASGGGGMGVPLMDGDWRYGADTGAIFSSIRDGRPNGMPAFGGRVTDDQIWRMAAYVRSMSGMLRSDVAPGRTDALQAAEPEARRKRAARPARHPTAG